MPRPTCLRCRKPAVACVCASLAERVDNRTPIWIAQHPRERDHPLGTARLARLGLQRVTVEQVAPGSPPPASLPASAVVLSADPYAPELDASVAGALVVVDGTWPHARSLLRRCPWLGALPRVRLEPRAKSRYRLRREPAPQCLSTIEAIVEALRRLEPDTPRLDGLLEAFDAMIDRQIELMGPRPLRVHRPTLPRSLQAVANRFVTVAVEVAPRPREAGDPLLLAHLVAHRLRDGTTFEGFGRLPAHRAPGPCHLADMGLEARHLDEGLSPGALRAAWEAFVQPEDIVVAWTPSTLDALRRAGCPPPRAVTLKPIHRRQVPDSQGPLADQARQLGREAPAVGAGRAGRDVAILRALLEHLTEGFAPLEEATPSMSSITK